MVTMNTALARQQAHVARLRDEKFDFGLTVGAAFVRGMRKSGYKSTAKALDELLDNSFEAGAANVHVVCGYEGSKSEKKPEQIAVIDDGAGMIPDMIRVAVLWGGTDRENNRTGIGRFGYGLPSSCISQGKRFEVYSRPEGGEWHMCAVDLAEIEQGKYTATGGHIIVPAPAAAKLPRFVQEYIEKTIPGGKLGHGTVVVIDKLDEISWKTTNALQDNLLKHFGVTYHKLRSLLEIYVNGVRSEPIDPLFQTPGFRWYDLDADRATMLDPLEIAVKDKESRETKGLIRVRFSWMPQSFGSKDKNGKAQSRNQNERFEILKDLNGIVVARMGRVIDTAIPPNKYMTLVNYDRYHKIEIDFDAGLDEEFNVPTTKQRVDVSERIWEILQEHGLFKVVEKLRKMTRADIERRETIKDVKPDEQRPSEVAMERAAATTPAPSPVAEEKRSQQGRRRLRQEAEKKAVETGKPVEEVEQALEAEYAGKPYKVEKRAVPGGSFFEVEYFGGTKRLWLNTETRFYTNLYAATGTTPSQRFALEVLLFSIGDCMLESRDEFRAMYDVELPNWSRKLEYALAQLEQNSSVASKDDTAAAAEIAETQSEAAE